MVNNQYRDNSLHIKTHNLVSIEKPFPKTHAPVFELMVDWNLIAFIPEPDRYLLTC